MFNQSVQYTIHLKAESLQILPLHAPILHKILSNRLTSKKVPSCLTKLWTLLCAALVRIQRQRLGDARTHNASTGLSHCNRLAKCFFWGKWSWVWRKEIFSLQEPYGQHRWPWRIEVDHSPTTNPHPILACYSPAGIGNPEVLSIQVTRRLFRSLQSCRSNHTFRHR